MIESMQLSDLTTQLGGQLQGGDCRFAAVSTDTRSLQPGDLYLALSGERFDGHDFATQAASAGACGLVVARPLPVELPQWIVADTVKTYGELGTQNRKRFQQPLVAITGSNGKTTVKNLLAGILAQCGTVLATEGNENNQIGVPKTLLKLSAEHDFAVIEMGTSFPGEIPYLSRVGQPDVAVALNAMPAHLEGLGSLEAIQREKGCIYTGLRQNGIAVFNLDEPACSEWRQRYGMFAAVTFSVRADAADVHAAEITPDKLGRPAFVLCIGNGRWPVQMKLLGRHNVANALAAAACAHAIGIEPALIAKGLNNLAPTPGRMCPRQGRGGSQLVDDSYNANPGSLRAAIDWLAARAGETVLVMGDMAELGADEIRAHREIGEHARRAGIQQLWGVGPLSNAAVTAFGDGGKHYHSRDALLAALEPQLHSGQVVLIKGSRSAAMDAVVRALATDGEQ